MDAIEVLLDLAGRPIAAAEELADKLTPAMLNQHVGGHDNSVAWLLWHTGREIDVQLASLGDAEQVWHALGFKDRFNLGSAGDGIGYGHSAEEARSIVIDDKHLLVEYVKATAESLANYISSLSETQLDDIVDERWDPPVKRGVRLISIIDDAIIHLGQAAYITGTRS